MRIIDFLQKVSIDLHCPATVMSKGDKLADADTYLQAVLAREPEGSTGIGEGITIPIPKPPPSKLPAWLP